MGTSGAGSNVHLGVDTLGQLLAAMVTPANEQARAQVDELAAKIREMTGYSVEIAFVDPGYTGDQPAEDAEKNGIRSHTRDWSQAIQRRPNRCATATEAMGW